MNPGRRNLVVGVQDSPGLSEAARRPGHPHTAALAACVGVGAPADAAIPAGPFVKQVLPIEVAPG
jgi:hypothetical protein